MKGFAQSREARHEREGKFSALVKSSSSFTKLAAVLLLFNFLTFVASTFGAFARNTHALTFISYPFALNLAASLFLPVLKGYAREGYKLTTLYEF